MKLNRIAVIIILTFAVATLVTYVSNPGTTPPIYATRLKVSVPGTAKVGNQIQVVITAVDNQSRTDYRRDDILRLALNPGARAALNATTISLSMGQAVVTLQGVVGEQVTIYATWVSGYSFLQPATATVTFS